MKKNFNTTSCFAPAVMESWAQIENVKENWTIETNDVKQGKQRELSQINIHMPAGIKWQGNIQDLMAMHKFLDNAINDIGPDACYAETITELKQMRSHFTKE